MKRKAVMKAKRYIDKLVARNASPRRVKRAAERYNRRIEVRDRLNLQDLFETSRLGNHL